MLFFALLASRAFVACKRSPPAPDKSKPENTATIEACAAIVEKSGIELEQAWRQRAAGTSPTPSITAGAIARVCSPLYALAACRTAHEHFDDTALPERAHALVRSCQDAYCPLLSQPKPALCARMPSNASEMAAMWDELNEAILRHDLGGGAERLIAARHTASQRFHAAVSGYVQAGSPAFSTASDSGATVRMLAKDVSAGKH